MGCLDSGSLHRKRYGLGFEFFFDRARIWRVHVQIVTGYHVQMVPKLVLIVFQAAHLRVEQFHDLDYGHGLRGPFVLLRYGLQITHHVLYVSSVFIHPESIAGGVVFEFDVVFDFFHAPKIMKIVRILLSLWL